MPGFWRRVVSKFSGEDPTVRLATHLQEDVDSSFIEALTEAVTYADKGSDTGIRAMEMAMRHRAGRNDLRFLAPKLGSLSVRSGDSASNASEYLLEKVEAGQLLDDAESSQDLISACLSFHGEDGVRNCMLQARDIGGLKAFYSFQLLYNHLLQSVKLAHARGERSWTEQQEAVQMEAERQAAQQRDPRKPTPISAAEKKRLEESMAQIQSLRSDIREAGAKKWALPEIEWSEMFFAPKMRTKENMNCRICATLLLNSNEERLNGAICYTDGDDNWICTSCHETYVAERT